MREDLDKVLKGPETSNRKYYIFVALSDLMRLFRAAIKNEKKPENEFSKQFPETGVVLVDKSKIKNCLKKLDYYLAFTKDYLEL